MKKKILAFVLTMLMVCQLGVIAFADEPEETTIETTVTVTNGNGKMSSSPTGAATVEGKDATVNSDISTTDSTGVSVSVNEKGTTSSTTVTVNGDTVKSDPTIDVKNSSDTEVDGVNLSVTGSVNSSTGGNATGIVDVNGGIKVNNTDNSVDVDGVDVNVTSGTNSTATGIVKVDGVEVVNGDGIDVDVTSAGNASSTSSVAKAEIYIYDDVTVTGGKGIVVDTNNNGKGSKGTVGTTTAVILVDGVVESTDAAVVVNGTTVPTIIVSGLTTTGNTLIDGTLKDAVINQIYYIIKGGEESEHIQYQSNDNIKSLSSVLGDSYSNYDYEGAINYDLIKEGQTITLRLDSGYELADVGGTAEYSYDATTGLYTVTVKQGGNLIFSARMKYVPVAYSTTTSTITNSMKGDKNSSTQPIMVVNMKASHFQKVMVDGTDLAESNFVVGAKENGLLTFQFSTSYIKSLAAGTYSLQFVTTENVTYTMKLVMAEDGTYTVSF